MSKSAADAIIDLAKDLDSKELRSVIDRLETRFAGMVHELSLIHI